ncbi:MAG: amidohydrolase family protein [Planctomycetes bacterium]|nr:amidohydrolase family protein [Planctomycetota bacterium]
MKRIVSTLVLILAVGGLTKAQNAVAFQVDRIHAGNGVVHEPGMLLIKDGKIVAVGDKIEIPKGTPLIRRPGCEITAGLIDAAVPDLVASTEQVSEVIPELQVADSIDLGAEVFARLARDGVTTVFATAALDSVIGCQGAVLKTGSTATLVDRAGDCKLTLTHDPSGRNGGPRRGRAPTVFTRRPTSQMGVVFVARDAFMRSADLIARGLKPRRGSAEEVLVDVLAGKKGLRLRAGQQYEIAAGLRMGQEFGFGFVLEGGAEAWRLTEELAGAKIPVILDPQRRQEEGGRGRRGAALERDASAAALAKAGVVLALSAGAGEGEYGLARQASHARRHGLDFAATLAAVTTTPARLLGLEQRIGRIAPGYDADLVIWTGEPFAATSGIDMVLVDGNRVRGKSY